MDNWVFFALGWEKVRVGSEFFFNVCKLVEDDVHNMREIGEDEPFLLYFMYGW
jgi:hypothetical protein